MEAGGDGRLGKKMYGLKKQTFYMIGRKTPISG